MAAIWTIFSKSGNFFPVFEKGQGRSPLLPSSYTTIVTRACRILLLTKFTIMKLKIDVFSVSTIFFYGALRWELSVASFVERALYSPA